MEISKLLLPRKEYLSVYEKNKGNFPPLEIIKDSQILFYFGGNHSRDINNKQFPLLKSFWKRFLELANNHEKIVLIESDLRQPAKSAEEAISSSSEAGYITFLASERGVDVQSADLSDRVLTNLLPNFHKEDILLYWFLVLVDNLRRHPEPRKPFEDYFENWKISQQKKEIWNGLDISFDQIKKNYLKNVGKEFSLNESQNYLIDPNRVDTKINEISKAQSDLRDVHIVSVISENWQKGKSVFVVFGNGHLIIQEPALRELIV